MRFVRCTAALGPLVAFCVGCSTDYGCPANSCSAGVSPIFNMSCGPTDLTSVTLSGPCATGDASPSNYVWGYHGMFLGIESSQPGVCHVELTFATGFTYSTDVTFALQPDPTRPGCAPCPAFVGPTQGRFMVNNPSTTCVAATSDAAPDAPSAMGDRIASIALTPPYQPGGSTGVVLSGLESDQGHWGGVASWGHTQDRASVTSAFAIPLDCPGHSTEVG